VLQLPSGAGHLDSEEKMHIAGYAEIHGGISPDDQAPARQRKYSSMLRKID
jgi:hypothetical protein